MKINDQTFEIIKLQEADWLTLKTIRLEALSSKDAKVFGLTYEQESAQSEDDWKWRLNDQRQAYFGLFLDNRDCIGLTGIYTNEKSDDTANLFASYIRSEYRGKGLSSLFYDARINWARENGYKKIIVSHRDGNDASKAANQRFGFNYTHTENYDWPDGSKAAHIYYQLNL